MTMNPTAPVGPRRNQPTCVPCGVPATDESGPPQPPPRRRRRISSAYQAMYDYFNAQLFGGHLQPVILNFSRHAGALGFFGPGDGRGPGGRGQRPRDQPQPHALRSLPPIEVASTLVHEMVHLWQQEYGDPSRTGYHNHEWETKMESVGLVPSDTGKPGGKKVGQKMADYPGRGGPVPARLRGDAARVPAAVAGDRGREAVEGRRHRDRHTQQAEIHLR